MGIVMSQHKYIVHSSVSRSQECERRNNADLLRTLSASTSTVTGYNCLKFNAFWAKTGEGEDENRKNLDVDDPLTNSKVAIVSESCVFFMLLYVANINAVLVKSP
jgi:hypothetical protein